MDASGSTSSRSPPPPARMKQSSRYVMRTAQKKKRRPFVYDNCNSYDDSNDNDTTMFKPSLPRPNETELVAINLHEQASSLPHPEECRGFAPSNYAHKMLHLQRKCRTMLLRTSSKAWMILCIFGSVLFLSTFMVSMQSRRHPTTTTNGSSMRVGNNNNNNSDRTIYRDGTPATLLTLTDFLVRNRVAVAADFSVSSSSFTPQYYAAEWLTEIDHAVLPETRDEVSTFLVRYALAVHFFSLGGVEQWKERLSFLDAGVHVCDWRGVLPDVNGVLQDMGVLCDAATNTLPLAIHLDHMGMKGTIPSEVALLTTLMEYNVHANTIGGTIPLGFCNLRNLRYLRLDDNIMAGTLPSCLASNPELRHLYLGDNRITGTLPAAFAASISLSRLVIGQNSMTGDPMGVLEAMTQLEWLFAEYNTFTGPIFRHTFQNHAKLQHLDLSGNQLALDTTDQSFPHHLFALPSLESLDLSSNRLIGTIAADFQGDIATLKKLKYLSLGQNELHGTIPQYFQELQSLEHLDIADNFFTGEFPSLLGDLLRLQFLSAANNPFLIGLFPQSFSNWHHMVDLNLRKTGRAGHIPPYLANSRNLAFLDIGFNQLTGPIPTELGRLTSLSLLFMNNNALTGTIPVQFAQLQQMRSLIVEGNHGLTGDVNFLCSALPRKENIFVDCHQMCTCCTCCEETLLADQCAGSYIATIDGQRETEAVHRLFYHNIVAGNP